MKEGFKKGFGETFGGLAACAVIIAAFLAINKNSQNKEKTEEK